MKLFQYYAHSTISLGLWSQSSRVGSFGGSSMGLVVGQAAIPIRFVGGLIGSVVRGLAGSLMANITANAVLQ